MNATPCNPTTTEFERSVVELGFANLIEDWDNLPSDAGDQFTEWLQAARDHIVSKGKVTTRDLALCRAAMPAVRRVLEQYLCETNPTNNLHAQTAVRGWLASHDIEARIHIPTQAA